MIKVPSTTAKPGNVEQYIAGFPPGTRRLLKQVRKTIRKAAPAAGEVINYGIPTFVLEGNLVHYAGYNYHIGFYPAPSAIRHFKDDLALYEGAKGSVKFRLDKPLPLELISRIVQFRVTENLEKAARKKSLRTCKSGHKYYKSTDCNTCPVCEQERKPEDDFLSLLAAPARRALEHNHITTPEELSNFSEAEVLKFHGMGAASMPKLRMALKENGLSFKAN